MQALDKGKVGALILGITGIYGMYFATGIIQEAVYLFPNLELRSLTSMMRLESINYSIFQSHSCSSLPPAPT